MKGGYHSLRQALVAGCRVLLGTDELIKEKKEHSRGMETRKTLRFSDINAAY